MINTCELQSPIAIVCKSLRLNHRILITYPTPKCWHHIVKYVLWPSLFIELPHVWFQVKPYNIKQKAKQNETKLKDMIWRDIEKFNSRQTCNIGLLRGWIQYI